MRITEIANSSEYLTPEELHDALDEAEIEAAEEASTLDALLRRKAALAEGPPSELNALDVEIRTRSRRVSLMQAAILEVNKRYQAVTRWQPRQRVGVAACNHRLPCSQSSGVSCSH